MLQSHQISPHPPAAIYLADSGLVLPLSSSPWLPWPKRPCCQLKWVANADYCEMLLHGGPLTSHLPNNVKDALKMVNKQHLQPRRFKLVLSQATADVAEDTV